MWEKQSAANSHLCVVSGLLGLLGSFLHTLLATSAFTSFFSPVLRCWFRVLLHIMRSAARPSQDVKCFYVSLAEILVAQLWVAFGSPSRCQLSIENVFWDAAIPHVVDMPQPTQPALSERERESVLYYCGKSPCTNLVQTPNNRLVLVAWLLNSPATNNCISGTNLLKR